MKAEDVNPGMRVRAERTGAEGTATGQISIDRMFPMGQARAEVRWDVAPDISRWPLVSVIEQV